MPFDFDAVTAPHEICSLTVAREDDGLRLDAFLARRMPYRSRTVLQRLVRDGKATVDGARARASRTVREGNIILVDLPKHPRDREGASLDLDILFEDEHLIAVDKPAGVPAHPAGKWVHRTVLTQLCRVLRERGEAITPSLVHRLDRETSGVLLLAKDRASLAHLARQMRRREIRKTYLAIVQGVLGTEGGLIAFPIGPALPPARPPKQIVRADGRPAQTRYRVLEQRADTTLLEIAPLTGRQHQIRVHLAALGHPVVGDAVYGRAGEIPYGRLMLHSLRLEFLHPFARHTLTIEAPPPREFGLEGSP
ncbi:MAG: RluA family pseudouridine synthase [Planctomycetota bacterium]